MGFLGVLRFLLLGLLGLGGLEFRFQGLRDLYMGSGLIRPRALRLQGWGGGEEGGGGEGGGGEGEEGREGGPAGACFGDGRSSPESLKQLLHNKGLVAEISLKLAITHTNSWV